MSVITISRQSGSRGNEVAKILSQKLGYRIFDKEMMIQLAKDLPADTEVTQESSLAGGTEKSLFNRIIGAFQSALEAGHESRQEIAIEEGRPLTVRQVHELIMAAYQLGDVVIVGRGSQVVLAGLSGVLHVRVVAPLAKRIKTWRERENLSQAEARKKVRERDRAHVDFVKNFFDTDLRDTNLYDLVINLDKLTPEAAVDLIMHTLQQIPPPEK